MLANPWQFAPPVDAHEAYLVTELGNIFPIENQTVAVSNQAANSIAYNLMLQGALMETLDFDGMVLHGDVSTEAEMEDLTEWVTIDSDTKHAGAILDGTGASIVIPRFYSTYRYSNGQLSEMSHTPPVDLINIGGPKTVFGTVTESRMSSGMSFSGTGWSIIWLGPVDGGSYTIQGTVPTGATVNQITSPNGMLGTYYDGSRYVLVDDRSFYATTSGKTAWDYRSGHDGFRLQPRDWSWVGGTMPPVGICNRPCVLHDANDNSGDLIKKIIWTRDASRGYFEHEYFYYVPNYGEPKLQSGLPVYVKGNPSFSQTSASSSSSSATVVLTNLDYSFDIGDSQNPYGTTKYPSGTYITNSFSLDSSYDRGYQKITKVAADVSFHYKYWVSLGNPHNPPTNRPTNGNIDVTGKVTIKDTRPYDTVATFTGDFERTLYNPSNTYLLVKPGGNTVTVKGVNLNQQSDIIFGLSGAPADTYYSMLVDGATTYGKTTPSGSIVLREGDITVSDYNVPGAITFYPNALKHADYSFGMVGFDLENDATFRFGNSPLIHVPEEFVKVRAWADVYVTDVTLAGSGGSVTLHYLSGQYDAGDIITVPYVKLYDSFRMTIDGQTTLPMNFTDVPRITS